MLLPYILMWSPPWVSCFFQRSSPLVNAHIAASECRASSGSEPAGRAKHDLFTGSLGYMATVAFREKNLHTSLEGFVSATPDRC